MAYVINEIVREEGRSPNPAPRIARRRSPYVAAREAHFRQHAERVSASKSMDGGTISRIRESSSSLVHSTRRCAMGRAGENGLEIPASRPRHTGVAELIEKVRHVNRHVECAVHPSRVQLTSLVTMLRLPNRKTRPLLRTVITLALRKMEHRAATGAGRGTRTWPKSANPGAIAPGLVLCRRRKTHGTTTSRSESACPC